MFKKFYIALSVFTWNFFFRHLPGYYLRKVVLNFLLGNKISWKSSIHRGMDIWYFGGINIDDHSVVNKFVSLDGRGGIYIGKNVSISPYVKIITASHDPDSANFEYITHSVVIEDYVWIGIGAIILPGVTLKKGCVVAAGSVVSKNVGEYEIVGGNPSRLIRLRNNQLNYNPFWEPWHQ